MSWKEKIEFKDMVLFCNIYRSRKEIEQQFGLTPIESHHACKWFSKFTEDFEIVSDVGETGRAIWLKSTKEALNHYNEKTPLV